MTHPNTHTAQETVKLIGATCAVTGASSGLGRGIAVALADAGAQVWAVARRRSELETTAQQVTGTGQVVAHAADLTSQDQLTHFVDALLEQSDGLDVLVHVRVARALCHPNSSAGLHAPAGLVSYSASKQALTALAEGLREEVNRYGVRVISLYPGRTATPLQERIYAAESRRFERERLMQPDDVTATVLLALTLPRSAEITDVSIRPLRKP